MLQIVTSNRLEELVERLAEQLRRPLASPFAKEVIVVQSKGMQRWLSMELSRHFGVWANGDFPFPNAFIWRLFRAVIPDLPENSPFDPSVLAWRLMGMLPGMLGRPGFEPLGAYLGGGESLKLFQLAGKLADTFDQYTLFRPEMLAAWEKGKDDGWQAELWRDLTAGTPCLHRGRVREEFTRLVLAGSFERSAFPERVALFGVSYLPAFHLEVLAQLARHAEVNLFLLSPCAEYWGDIVSARERARQPVSGESYDEGNPLLSSLGRLGRDFSDTLLSLDAETSVENDRYRSPGEGSLLRTLQGDILLLRRPEEAGRVEIPAADRSLQVHSCHGPMREIEVLHDQLLRCFEADPTLTPRDILVMTPEIEEYAPFITAVFDGVEEQARRIPYSIADRSIRREGQIAEVLLAILALPAGRFGVTGVLDILESPPVRRRFGLDEDALETIRGWLEETGIRWGIDGEDRARLGLPPFRENSWQAGLDRLFLGYAMADEGSPFAGIIPFDAMEGEAVGLLGCLADCVERLAAAARDLGRPRTLDGWEEAARRVLDGFVAPDEESVRELAAVSRVLDDLGQCREAAGFAGEVAPEVFRFWLAERLGREEKGLGFLTGSVTFCAMLPMRSIPFRVIALVGMNDGAFPRQNRPPGFDLMAKQSRRGDRSLRDEDRYLFLEALLSARDTLYLSYTGQGIRDNAEIPPSVLLSELLDHVGSRFALQGELVTRHPLQPFSRSYFPGSAALVSYSAENCAALLAREAHPRRLAPFLTRPLPVGEEWRDVTFAQLLRFFDNPARFLLERRLGIRLEELSPPLEEREPFAVEGLAAYRLREELLAISLEGGEPAAFLPVARARGMLPPARHGAALFADICAEVAGFAARVRQMRGTGEFLPPLDLELDCGGFLLTGRLERISPERLVRYRCATRKARDQVRLWLEHLLLNALAPPGYPRESCLVMTDRSVSFAPVENAGQELERVLGWFRRGLGEPLRFFPATSLAYGAKGEWDLEKARRAWEGTEFSRGEGEDRYLELCFRGSDPLAGDFERIARELLGPMVEAQTP